MLGGHPSLTRHAERSAGAPPRSQRWTLISVPGGPGRARGATHPHRSRGCCWPIAAVARTSSQPRARIRTPSSGAGPTILPAIAGVLATFNLSGPVIAVDQHDALGRPLRDWDRVLFGALPARVVGVLGRPAWLTDAASIAVLQLLRDPDRDGRRAVPRRPLRRVRRDGVRRWSRRSWRRSCATSRRPRSARASPPKRRPTCSAAAGQRSGSLVHRRRSKETNSTRSRAGTRRCR